jgi:aminoglycoside phosphotransferase (APT) family kinase protein
MTTEASPPPATGERRPWTALPGAVRAAVQEYLGARVVEAVTQPGGFSPGVAARLGTADGRRAFIKAVGPEPNPDSPGIHRAEARIAAALPASAPVPRLLWSYDDGEWVALLFEDVEGRLPTLPWQPDQLRRVLEAVAELAVALTPTPVAAPPVDERMGDNFHGWRRLAGDQVDGRLLASVDGWARSRLDQLAELEDGWGRAAAGATLLHLDLRADNLLLTPTRVVVVDWPWACAGAAWVDLLFMLPSVAMQGGPDPEALFTGHPVSRETDPAAVDAVLAAVTGFFVEKSLQPPVPGLPALRAFQAAQGRTALAWLRRRLEHR